MGRSRRRLAAELVVVRVVRSLGYVRGVQGGLCCWRTLAVSVKILVRTSIPLRSTRDRPNIVRSNLRVMMMLFMRNLERGVLSGRYWLALLVKSSDVIQPRLRLMICRQTWIGLRTVDLGERGFVVIDLDRIDLWLLAARAEKVEVISLCLVWFDAMAGAVLPYVAVFAGEDVGSIIEILAMNATNGAIKVPMLIGLAELLLQLTDFSLLPFNLRQAMALRPSRVSITVGGVLGLQFREFLLLENALHFTIFESLLAGHHT